jgi:hypothetical protein
MQSDAEGFSMSAIACAVEKLAHQKMVENTLR